MLNFIRTVFVAIMSFLLVTVLGNLLTSPISHNMSKICEAIIRLGAYFSPKQTRERIRNEQLGDFDMIRTQSDLRQFTFALQAFGFALTRGLVDRYKVARLAKDSNVRAKLKRPYFNRVDYILTNSVLVTLYTLNPNRQGDLFIGISFLVVSTLIMHLFFNFLIRCLFGKLIEKRMSEQKDELI